MVAPPFSLRGIAGSLRAPTLRDAIYSTKAFVASALCLAIGFGLNLENPYWSVLTVYIIVNPPGAGAVRSKAIFRMLGTLIGGALVLLATSLFADQIGILLAAAIGIIVGASFLNQIDKSPSGYLWFAVAVTTAVVALGNLSSLDRTFELTTARVGEIFVGILVTAAVDCVWPEPMTPPFIKALADWLGQGREFAAIALSSAGSESSYDDRRAKLRDLVKGIQIIDAKAIQLPFDVVERAPRRRDLDLVRRQMVAVIGDLVAIGLRARSLDGIDTAPVAANLPAAIATWLDADAGITAETLDGHLERGRTLAHELDQARRDFDPATGWAALARRGLLSRLSKFVRDWCDLLVALHAVQTGARLPTHVAGIAVTARPVRSIDYLGAALDVLPLLLAMSTSALIWYLTAWVNGPSALLFSFAGCVFLVGQDQVLQSTAGFLACILTAFCLVFVYQFAVLPRVTDFPVLIMVLGCALLPIGLLMAMSGAGLLISNFALSFLGLQNAYAADFVQSLQTLTGSLVGLLIAVICLRLCAYDHARFASRRLAAAARQDVIDIARTRHPPDPDRFAFLGFYRLSLYFAAAEQVAGGAPLPRLGLLDDLSIGLHLLNLRRQERAVSPGARRVIEGLRADTAAAFLDRLQGRADDTALRCRVDAAIDDPAIRDDPAGDALLDDLVALGIALRDTPQRHVAATP